MSSHRDSLFEKIDAREARVGVVGLGYVGLPLAAEFADAGFRVLGFDISEPKVEGLNRGRSHIRDVEQERIAEATADGRLSATTDFARLGEMDALCICVPTPLNKTGDPDVSYIMSVTESIKKTIRPGQLVVLESTTYPGTTREILLPALSEAAGLTVGEDLFLAFSPERVDPGNRTWTIRNTPKVVGGITAVCAEAAESLYSTIIDHVVVVSSTEAAELVKLLENTFRSVNIALANEMAVACDRLGVDVWEVIEAAATKPFGFMKFTPGPGLGGHCIPVDPHYLSWKMKTLDYRTRLIDLASEINAEMPQYVAKKTADVLNEQGKAVKGSRVLVVGVAYKKDVDDTRESPALDIIRLLAAKGADVQYHDPLVPTLESGDRVLRSTPLEERVLASQDVVVIITDHTDLDYERIDRAAVPVLDTRNVLPKTAMEETRSQARVG